MNEPIDRNVRGRVKPTATVVRSKSLLVSSSCKESLQPVVRNIELLLFEIFIFLFLYNFFKKENDTGVLFCVNLGSIS